jgi:hypothetical protein
MAEMPHVNERSEPAHEVRDVQIKPILGFGIGLIVITLGVLALMGVTFDALSARRSEQNVPPSPLAKPASPFPEPRLQVAPAQDLQKLLAEENAVLSSYGWVNRARGVVRIPIDRAMDLLVERGLPARATKSGDP